MDRDCSARKSAPRTLHWRRYDPTLPWARALAGFQATRSGTRGETGGRDTRRSLLPLPPWPLLQSEPRLEFQNRNSNGL